ncbi:MAG: hypothetical protein ACOCUH_00320 [Bacteriovoracia bacterium]
MKEGIEVTNNHWVYYLKLGKNLPPFFNELSHRFNDQGINLLPVEFDQLQKLWEYQKELPILVIATEIQHHKRLQLLMKKLLAFAVKSSMVKLFHLSSFKPYNFNILHVRQLKSMYYYRRLPKPLTETVNWIAEEFWASRSKLRRWPGGRRGKLPSDCLN